VKIVILKGGSGGRRRRPFTGPARTRERGAMAVGDGKGRWVLINLSPSVAHQLDWDPSLDDHPGLPDADVRAVLLTDAQVDHVGGLLSLRDGAPIDLYATPAVFEELTTALPVLPVLQHYCGVQWHVVPVAGDREQADFQIKGMPSLAFTALAIRAPAPPHLGRHDADQVGDSIALAVHDLETGQRAFCAPGLAHFNESEVAWMREADCLFVDGPPPSADPQRQAAPEPDAPWLTQLSAMPARTKVLMGQCGLGLSRHGDGSRPMGAEGTAAERTASSPGGSAGWSPPAGISLAYDGMAIDL
jgi:pyrroloquinoline quinone biosynthesis protein B